MLKSLLTKNKVAKNAGWLIGEKIVQMILSLFVGTLTVRYLGPSNYGLINYASSLISFFMSLCTLGINSVIVKELLDHPDKQGEILGSSIGLRLISSSCSVILVVAVSFFLDYGQWETIVVVALSSLSLVFHSFDSINRWFQSQYNSKITALATLIAYIAISLYKIVLLVLNKSVMWFAFSASVEYIALAAVLLIAYRKCKGHKFSFSWSTGKSILSKSYHYILSGLMVSIYGHTDKLMLKHMLTDEQVGFYSISTALCSMWTFVLSAIIDSFYPEIVQAFNKDYDLFKKRNRQLYAIVFYVSTFVSLCFVVLGRFVICLLYGEAYLPATLPLKIVTWYTAFSYLGVARSPWMVCHNKQKYIKVMYIPAVIINIVLNYLLIPRIGAAGAALASLVTQIFTSILLPLLIKDLRPNAILMLEAITLKDFKDIFVKKKTLH